MVPSPGPPSQLHVARSKISQKFENFKSTIFQGRLHHSKILREILLLLIKINNSNEFFRLRYTLGLGNGSAYRKYLIIY